VNSSDFDKLENRFKEELGDFLFQLPPVGVVDVAAIPRICEAAEEISRALKGEPLVSKSLLWDFRATTKILRAEAPYMREHTERLIEMADRLEGIFDLILLGESPEDRVPGMPRTA
jgi:hypothetical protein